MKPRGICGSCGRKGLRLVSRGRCSTCWRHEEGITQRRCEDGKCRNIKNSTARTRYCRASDERILELQRLAAAGKELR